MRILALLTLLTFSPLVVAQPLVVSKDQLEHRADRRINAGITLFFAGVIMGTLGFVFTGVEARRAPNDGYLDFRPWSYAGTAIIAAGGVGMLAGGAALVGLGRKDAKNARALPTLTASASALRVSF